MKVPVPERLSPRKVFLWNKPNKATWDSLFIDGTYEKDGETVSKNFLQDTIKKALNFEGSPIEEMLEGLGELPDLTTEEPEQVAPVVKTATKRAASAVKKSAPAPETKSEAQPPVNVKSGKRASAAKTPSGASRSEAKSVDQAFDELGLTR